MGKKQNCEPSKEKEILVEGRQVTAEMHSDTEIVLLFLNPQCKVNAFTCLKENNDCSGSERKLSALLHHHFDQCLFPSSFSFLFLFFFAFNIISPWQCAKLLHCNICGMYMSRTQRGNASTGAAMLTNETPLTCQPAPWLCVPVSPLTSPKTKLNSAPGNSF